MFGLFEGMLLLVDVVVFEWLLVVMGVGVCEIKLLLFLVLLKDFFGVVVVEFSEVG